MPDKEKMSENQRAILERFQNPDQSLQETFKQAVKEAQADERRRDGGSQVPMPVPEKG